MKREVGLKKRKEEERARKVREKIDWSWEFVDAAELWHQSIPL